MQLNKNTHNALLCYELQNGYASSPQRHFIPPLPIFLNVYRKPTTTNTWHTRTKKY